jgi:hypothetical protein
MRHYTETLPLEFDDNNLLAADLNIGILSRVRTGLSRGSYSWCQASQMQDMPSPQKNTNHICFTAINSNGRPMTSANIMTSSGMRVFQTFHFAYHPSKHQAPTHPQPPQQPRDDPTTHHTSTRDTTPPSPLVSSHSPTAGLSINQSINTNHNKHQTQQVGANDPKGNY